MNQFLGWRYAQFLFHINIISNHWLELISVQTDSFRVRSASLRLYVRIVFALCCLRGKQRIHNNEYMFILYAISRVPDFERYNWLKTIIFIKIIREIPSWSRFTINGILLQDASSKLYFCEGTRKKRNGAITSPFVPIINLTRSDCEVATVRMIEMPHFRHHT